MSHDFPYVASVIANLRTMLYSLLFISLPALAIPSKFTVREALQFAVDHAPSLVGQVDLLEIAKLQENNAHFALYPSLDFQGQLGLQNTNPVQVATEPYTSSLTLGITENLFDGGERWVRLRSSRADRELRELRLKDFRNDLAVRVLRAYFSFSLSERLRASVAEQKKTYEDQYELVSRLYRQGLKLEKEKSRFEAELERIRLDYRSAETDVGQKMADLKTVIGAEDPEIVFEPVDEEKLVLELPKAWPKPEESLPYQIAVKEVSNTQFGVELAKRAYFPRLEVTAGISYYNDRMVGPSSSLTANQITNLNAGLVLRYNIWDWGTRKRNIEVAQRQVSVQERQQQTRALELERDLGKLKLELELVTANLENAGKLAELEKKNYQALKTDYKEGRATSFELITGLTNLLDSRKRLFVATYATADALARYHYYRGTVYEIP